MAKAAKAAPNIELISLLPSWYRALNVYCLPLTVRSYQARMRRFLLFLAEHAYVTTVGAISQTICEEFLLDLKEHGKPWTVLNHYVALVSFFTWCVLEREITVSPMAHIHQPKVPRQLVTFLTDEEVSILLKTCSSKSFLDRRDLAQLRLFLSTGIRRGEMQRLTVTDVNIDKDVALVRHGKGGDPRFVAFDRRTSAAIDSYLRLRIQHPHADNPALWLTNRGAMNYETINAMIHKRADMAGLPGVHAHLFRHGFAHAYMAARGDIINLTSLGGWKSLDMVKNVYGAALQNQVAIDEHHDLQIGDKWK